jgi:hypothetical protein
VKFAVETTRLKAGGGEVLNKPNNMNQTMFRPENFRLTIDGLEQTCAKVSKIDALTVKQTVARDNIGDARDYQLLPGKLEMPNLKITFNQNVVEPMAAWHQTFVIEGKNDVSQEKNGASSSSAPTAARCCSRSSSRASASSTCPRASRRTTTTRSSR